MAAPSKAVGKNKNLLTEVRGPGTTTWVDMENGSGQKQTWAVEGTVEGQHAVYKKIDEIPTGAYAAHMAEGWGVSTAFPGYIYKLVQG